MLMMLKTTCTQPNPFPLCLQQPQHRRTLTSQRRALQTLVERSMSTAIVSPTEKLNYVLRFSKLDSKSEGGE